VHLADFKVKSRIVKMASIIPTTEEADTRQF
jgi:hypothetical protein